MSRNHKRRAYKAASLMALCLIVPLTAGCSSIGEFVADALPHWAGGLPAGAPPRPSDPHYEEYERALQAKADGLAKSEEPKTENSEMPRRIAP